MDRNEAIEIVRMCCPKISKSECDFETAMRVLVPELKESEDERIRKEIINYFKCQSREEPSRKDIHNKWIAWLEKQRQEPKKVSIWKHWKNGIAGNGEGVKIYLTKVGNTYNLSSCLSFECDYIELSELDNLMLEKQGEEEYALKSFRDKDVHKFMQYIEKQAKAYEFNLPNRSYDIYAFAKDILHWLEKQCEKKPAWSEEDERMYKAISIALSLNDAKGYLCSWYTTLEEADNWLKSIKDRVQPKQEWSINDERILNNIFTYLGYAKDGNKYYRPELICEAENWLKSLKPQPHWKPTEKQMNAFYWMKQYPAGEFAKKDILNSLYNDLKKL